jgi:hypothetical protein
MNVLQLSDRTKDIIANFSTINNSMLFNPGSELKTVSSGKDLVGYAKIKETIPKKFGIFDLSKVLSLLSLYKEATLQLNEISFTIISGNTKTYNCTYADETTILSPPEDKLALTEDIFSFPLSAKDLKELVKVMSISKLPEVALVVTPEEVSIQGIDHKKVNKDTYKNVLGNIPLSNTAFELHFSVEKFASIMPGEYKVTVGKLKNDMFVCKFVGDDIEYVIASESSSNA